MQIILTIICSLLIGTLCIPLVDVYSKERSIREYGVQCEDCKKIYSWFQLIPIMNLFVGNKCRGCKKPLPYSYRLLPIVYAGINLLLLWEYGLSVRMVLYCLAVSSLLTLSLVDWRIYEIPIQLNYFILVLGLINMLLDLRHWVQYVIGFFAVSGLLFLIALITKGRGMGGGDIKLMATAGLLIGWKLILLSLVIGSMLGSVIHLSIMKIKKAERMLAFGPYLSMGIIIAMIWGEQLISWYLGMIMPPVIYY